MGMKSGETRSTTNDKEGQAKLYSPEHAIKVDESGGRTTAQGNLYSPEYAIKVDNRKEKKQQEEEGGEIEEEASKGKKVAVVAAAAEAVKKNIVRVKERLLEKLTAASVPADALENARHYLETVVRDATVAAQGLTKEAIARMKSRLVVLLPSLPPALTGKMVDEAATASTLEEGNQAKNEMKQQQQEQQTMGQKSQDTSGRRLQPLSRM